MIRSYNTQHPAHWGWEHQISYALIYTALETLMKPVETKLKAYVTQDGLHKFHETGYAEKAMAYATDYHFVMSSLFTAMCDACDIDADDKLERVSPCIDFQHVRNGDALLAAEPMQEVVLELPHGDVVVTVPAKWSDGE